MTRILAILSTITLTVSMSAGGGWVKKKGQGYYKLGLSVIENEGYYGQNGVFLSNLDTRLVTASFYTEHGLSDRVSAELFFPFFMQHSVMGVNMDEMSLDDRTSGVGDANLGLRFSLLENERLVISGSAILGLPLGKATLGENMNLFTGDDEFNQLLRMDVSTPFGTERLSGFVTLYTGFNNRTDFFTDEFWYGIETGLGLAQKRLWLIGRVNGVMAEESDDLAMATNGFVTSMSFISYGVEAAFYTSEKNGISIGYQGLLDGDILLMEPNLQAGFFWDIK